MERKTVWDKLDPEEERQLQDYLNTTYAITPGTPPWKQGTYSRVYNFDNGQLLRLTCLTRRGHDLVANAQVVYHLAGELMPRVDHIQAFDMPRSGAVVMETIVEHIDNIPFAQWRSYFHTPSDLLVSLLDAGYDLESRGIIHRDISHNNILLSTDGTFTFIDADDACVPDGGHKSDLCSRPISGTAGYRLVEFDKDDTALSQLIIGGFADAAHAGIDSTTRLARGISAKKIVYEHPEVRAEHNMVHALVILAFVAITGAKDATTFFANYVRGAYPNFPKSWKLLLRCVCSADPNKRLNIEQALQFPLKNVGFEYFTDKTSSHRHRRRRRSGFA